MKTKMAAMLLVLGMLPVSYTHLDVYKRQELFRYGRRWPPIRCSMLTKLSRLQKKRAQM